MNHVNPFTKLSYKNDPDIIAAEINNEPHHSGAKEKTTEYVNRLADAIRNTGWSKPLFYNICKSPAYADAIAKARVDGFSFQWYPTGLVAGHELKGNFLQNADEYKIPYDTIPQFFNKARIVYEFDAGDVLQSNMFPAMARSFRQAGFQWATQFAYDPMATAYANTEYQTHYLNLAYTPSKAISLLIASKAFHKLQLSKSYGNYPADTLFDVFRVNYKNSLSEMNSDTEFYYSNTTQTNPLNANKLQHIAGTGSSPVVEYTGCGAYFIDKLEDGIWRLEVMPDAIHIRDPFEKASPEKEVTRIQWHTQLLQIKLPDLDTDFTVEGLNKGNHFSATASAGQFIILPGSYLLIRKAKENKTWNANSEMGVLQLNEFAAPKPFDTSVFAAHQPYEEVSALKPFTIHATIVGVDLNDTLIAEIQTSLHGWKNIPLQLQSAYQYIAEVPADIVIPGILSYRIIIKKKNEYYTFPGNHKGDPYAWDNINNDTWQTYAATEKGALEIFNASTDRNKLMLCNSDWRNNPFQFVASDKPHQLVLKITISNRQIIGYQLYIADRLKGRASEFLSFSKIVVRIRSTVSSQVKIALITSEAECYAAMVLASNEWKDVSIPLSSLKADSVLLLPRPYPGFQPLWFKTKEEGTFKLQDTEKIQVTFAQNPHEPENPVSVQIESIWLEK